MVLLVLLISIYSFLYSHISLSQPLYLIDKMIISLLQERLAEVSPFVAISATIGLLTFLGILTNHSSKSEPILPGIPKLKGYPIVGAIPIYFRHGMAILLETLTKLGDDGISYARVGNKTLVSVHDPAMVKEVLSFTDKVASRYFLLLPVQAVFVALQSPKVKYFNC